MDSNSFSKTVKVFEIYRFKSALEEKKLRPAKISAWFFTEKAQFSSFEANEMSEVPAT